MARFQEIITDDFLRPIPNVAVDVLTGDGTLADLVDNEGDPLPNPLKTDEYGQLIFNAPDAVYTLQYRFGGALRRIDNRIVGDPAEFRGSAGLAANTFSDLSLFRAASTTQFKVANLSLSPSVPGTPDGQFYFETAGAPYTADNVNVIKADDTPLSTGAWVRQGADKVAFKARAAAIARTAGDKLSDVIAATDYGTAADGVADDAAKLQQMLDDGAGGLVTLPQRNAVYKITSTLTVPADTEIDGQGSMIVSTMTTATDALVFTNGGGARNLTLVGPYPTGGTYTANNNGIACRGTNNAPAAPTFVRAPKLENVEVYGFGYAGIRLRYVERQTSSNVTVRNCGYAGIAGVSCNDVWVNGYTVRNIAPGVSLDAYGVFFDRDENGTLTADPTSFRCGATNVNISGVRAGGNGQGVDTHGGVEIYYEGTVNDCDVAGAFTASNVGGVATIGPKRCRARLTGSSDSQGYGFFVTGAVNGGAVADYAEDCDLDLNLTGYGKEVADGSIGGMMMRATKGLRVSGTLKNNRNVGIYVDQSNIAFDIRATIIDPCSTLFGAPSGVLVVGNDNRGRISATYRFENAALATNVALNAVRINSGLTGLDIDLEPSGFVGVASGRLAITALTTTGVRSNGLQTQTGTGSVSVANTGVDGILDVTFPKRFPYVPSVQATLGFPANGGGKYPVLSVREELVTETGFRIYAYPIDGTAWTATGSIPFRWTAN